MKVYAIFKLAYSLPFNTESLVDLYQYKDDADDECKKLQDARTDAEIPNGDDYGYYGGIHHGVVEMEVK